jgi:UDP:flavonoid glycosyltransferase YjiC (YdhE family)
MTGYWQTGTGYNHWALPESLANFIEGDEKPVMMTVGSMAEHEANAHEFQQILIDTARQIPGKVIILTNWEQGNNIDGNIYKLKGFVSYPVLFSKCSLVVHHGGIGALHQATGAGCPSVIITYGHDQPFNAKVLYDAGISSGSIHRKDLNAKDLANLINKALEDREMRQKAEQLAVLLRNENGVENAVKVIEEKANAEILIHSL